jgi:hypothetical protein
VSNSLAELRAIATQAPKKGGKYDGIEVYTMKINKKDVKVVKPTNGELANWLMRSLKKHWPYQLTDLVRVWGKVRGIVEEGDYTNCDVSGLYEYLKANTQEMRQEADNRIKQGLVSYYDLPFLFQDNGKVVGSFGDDLIGGEVSSVEEKPGWFGSKTTVKIKVISAVSGRVGYREIPVEIKEFSDLANISDLAVRPATETDLTALSVRGQKFRSYTGKPSYVRYDGQLTRRSWMGSRSFNAEGRVMVDAMTAGRMDNDLVRQYREWGEEEGREKEGLSIPDDQLWMCEPFVLGFSFRAKMWGELRVEQLSDIQFRADAIDKLVLDDERKKMILALVSNTNGSFSDVVDDKGGGAIFLLHGEPGVGKTLTAEAVAEYLKRPLYSVSIGELGTNPSELEDELREILDVASAWNAVILLDEADIFLEARNEKDIVRNAMVGVFLRLLEYHQGVLFLTTNRVKNFDKAFHSRISVALKYQGAGSEFREKVWNNLFQAAGIKGIEGSDVSHYEINGRQIKNTIRLAQTLAKSENRPVNREDIERTVAIAEQFQKDLQVG